MVPAVKARIIEIDTQARKRREREVTKQ